MVRFGLISLAVFSAASAAATVASRGPYPDYGTEAWRELFAVDPMPDPLGETPLDIGDGVTYSTTLKGELAGLDIGRVFLDVTVTDRGYQVRYKMEQRGIARWFSDGEATANASGLFDDQASIVSSYYFNHDWNGEDDQQRTEMFRDAGADRYRLWSLPEYNFRQPVSVEQAEDAVDPLGALVALAFTPVASGEEPCARSVPVLDGRRRFDLVMEPDGFEEIRRNGPGRYRGDAYRCRLTQRKVAGYKENDRGDIDGDIWVYMAEVPKELQSHTLRYVPVKIVARSGLIGASLQAKRPKLIEADGSVTEL